MAAPCAGFTDVDSTHAGCPSVEWLKNRSVTLGCATPGAYCPSDSVIRLSMAAFMNRLGVSLSPAILYHEANGPSLDLGSPPATVCITPPAILASYPRQASASVAFTALTGVTEAIVDLRLVQSTDGGATWTPVTTHPATFSGAARWVNAGTWKVGIPLVVGTPYRFGVAVVRSTEAASTGNLQAWNCQIKVVLDNRIATGSPW
jgi:hypothetical protein